MQTLNQAKDSLIEDKANGLDNITNAPKQE